MILVVVETILRGKLSCIRIPLSCLIINPASITSYDVMKVFFLGGLLWNPYPHFGRKGMWPRGLPFSSSKQADPTIGKTSCYPIVQQYLAQSNPDFFFVS